MCAGAPQVSACVLGHLLKSLQPWVQSPATQKPGMVCMPEIPELGRGKQCSSNRDAVMSLAGMEDGTAQSAFGTFSDALCALY